MKYIKYDEGIILQSKIVYKNDLVMRFIEKNNITCDDNLESGLFSNLIWYSCDENYITHVYNVSVCNFPLIYYLIETE